MKDPVVETLHGKLRGEFADGIFKFKGIRYGAPPKGDFRFMPPREPEPWAGIIDALHFGFAAPQSNPIYPPTEDVFQVGTENEDCLFLNVWTPGINDGAKRPVLFWLHGGGFIILSGSVTYSDGTNLAKRGAVIVTINHRLGALGYTHLGDIGGKDYAHSGNVGMLDIMLALKWVKNNIARFGGDPGRVMIFGNSGGGQKVTTLLGLPSAQGLFHRAVIQSGPGVKMIDRAHGNDVAEIFLKTLGLDSAHLHDIHKLPLQKIITAQAETYKKLPGPMIPGIMRGFGPVLDETLLPAHPFYPEAPAFSAGVPLIIGYTRTENTMFSPREMFHLDEAGLYAGVRRWLGNAADHIIDTYRKAHPGASCSEIYFLITSDYPTAIYSANIAERRAAQKQAATYMYRFDWVSPLNGGRLQSPHGAEVCLVFDNPHTTPLARAGGEGAKILASKLAETWIQFARTGNPNLAANGLPAWPPYEPDKRAMMLISDSSRVADDPTKDTRVIMDKLLN